tara:strand:- start:720 stop:1226 length:507 start_codon:yes stop_codon:yes gene_type:complete
MANTDRPHGFTVIEGNRSTHSYPVAAANSVIGVGDLVVLTAAGTIDIAAASATQIIGVAAESAAASSGGTILVYDDPNILIEGQMDNTVTTGAALAGMNANYNIVATAATNGTSNQEIDEDSDATTATLPLKALYLYPVPDNAYGEFNRIVCSINNHVKKSTGVDGLV